MMKNRTKKNIRALNLLILFALFTDLHSQDTSRIKFYERILIGFEYSNSNITSQGFMNSSRKELYCGYRFKNNLSLFLTSENLTQHKLDTNVYSSDNFFGIGLRYRFLIGNFENPSKSNFYIEPYLSYSGNADTSNFHGSGNLGVKFSPYLFPFCYFGMGARENYNSKTLANLSFYLTLGVNLTLGDILKK